MDQARLRKIIQSGKGRLMVAGGLVIVLLLAVLLPTGIKRVMEWNRPEPVVFEPIFHIKPAQVVTIDVRGQGDRVSLLRQNDTWQFSYPVDAKANTRAVQYFLDKLCEWTPEKKFEVVQNADGEGGSDAFGFAHQSVRYVLGDPTGKQVALTCGGQEKITDRIFAKPEDSRTIFLLPQIPFVQLKGLAFRLRDHRLFDKPLTDIVRINYREDQTAMTLEKNGSGEKRTIMPVFGKEDTVQNLDDSILAEDSWQVTYPYKFPANSQVVQMIVEAIFQWEATEFAEESVGDRMNLSRYGLSDPYGEISMLSSKGRFPLEIFIGRPYGEEGPVYVKTSIDSKIVKMKKEAVQTIQSLFNQVPSRQLAYFINQIAKVEIMTETWRITLTQDRDIWQAELQERLGQRNKDMIRRKLPDEQNSQVFSGVELMEALLSMEYIDLLDKENPFYEGFGAAKQTIKILFFNSSGNLKEVFKISRPKDSQEVLYLQRQSDGHVYLIRTDIADVIFSEIEQVRSLETPEP